ncbi:MAG: rubredoxin, partial [Clostridia bacterium]|nr:rubredoxin [Clostridia bacterium]
RFSVSIIAKDMPMETIGLFGFQSGKDVDKFAGVQNTTAPGGSPVLTEHCIGYFECDVLKEMDIGTHTLFVGVLSSAEVLTRAEPMTYAYYHEVKKGTAPKSAPTYREPEEKPAAGAADPSSAPRYRCTICGYIYDPAKGDPERGIKPGTEFEDLPPEWVCPICKAPKSKFVKE